MAAAAGIREKCFPDLCPLRARQLPSGELNWTKLKACLNESQLCSSEYLSLSKEQDLNKRLTGKMRRRLEHKEDPDWIWSYWRPAPYLNRGKKI
jgi:hypothetical protein